MDHGSLWENLWDGNSDYEAMSTYKGFLRGHASVGRGSGLSFCRMDSRNIQPTPQIFWDLKGIHMQAWVTSTTAWVSMFSLVALLQLELFSHSIFALCGGLSAWWECHIGWLFLQHSTCLTVHDPLQPVVPQMPSLCVLAGRSWRVGGKGRVLITPELLA